MSNRTNTMLIRSERARGLGIEERSCYFADVQFRNKLESLFHKHFTRKPHAQIKLHGDNEQNTTQQARSRWIITIQGLNFVRME